MIEDKNWEQVIPIIDSYEKAGRKNSSLEMLKFGKIYMKRKEQIIFLVIVRITKACIQNIRRFVSF